MLLLTLFTAAILINGSLFGVCGTSQATQRHDYLAGKMLMRTRTYMDTRNWSKLPFLTQGDLGADWSDYTARVCNVSSFILHTSWQHNYRLEWFKSSLIEQKFRSNSQSCFTTDRNFCAIHKFSINLSTSLFCSVNTRDVDDVMLSVFTEIPTDHWTAGGCWTDRQAWVFTRFKNTNDVK